MISRLAMSICAMLGAQVAPPSPQAPASVALPTTVQDVSMDDPGRPSIAATITSPRVGSTLPLIVISHGTGATETSHIDTVRALAQSGFVVIALRHPGDNFQDDSIVGKPEWFVDRSRHVSKAIDFMFTRWEGRDRLVAGRVGIFGFSAGATTALISIGGAPDLGRVPVHCARRNEPVCRLIASAPAKGGGGPPEPWVRDRRIAAAVVAAPGLGFAFAPAGLSNVSAPVQLWSAADDQIVPSPTNADVIRRLLPRTLEFHTVPGASHLSFLAPCTPATPPELCKDREGFDRAAFHREFNRRVAEFFRRRLAPGG